MSEGQNKVSTKWAIVTLGVVVVIIGGSVAALSLLPEKKVTNFEECVAAGGARMESYPERCMYNKKSYTNENQMEPKRIPYAPAEESGYIGLGEDEALLIAEENHTPARVVERDGEGLPTTMDYVYGRHNLYIQDGKVYKVEIEGQATDSN